MAVLFGNEKAFLCLVLMLMPPFTESRSFQVDTKEGLQGYLQWFGYAPGTNGEKTSLTPDQIKEAIAKYQAFFGLRVTGELDQATIAMMNRERCGVPDFPNGDKNFQPQKGPRRWAKNIRYRVDRTDQIPYADADRLVDKAIWEWQRWINTITIRKSQDYYSEILVSFLMSDAYGNHGDNSPFNENTLAHAFYPWASAFAGDVHVNMKKTFSFWEPPPYTSHSLLFVLVHELGHSLGLDHSNVNGSIMFPTYYKGVAYPGLHFDDKYRIQALYDKAEGCHKASFLSMWASLWMILMIFK